MNTKDIEMKEKILIIDDEPEIRDLLAELLEDEGYTIYQAEDGVEGLEVFKNEDLDLVITDVRMPSKSGIELLSDIRESSAEVDVIILTGQSDEATAIDCLRTGAYDYLLKPVEDIDVLLNSVNRALQKRNLEKQNKLLIKQLEDMAIRDPLTGLYNMRQFYSYLEEEISRSSRYKHDFCLLFLDIDHFKQVNDTYGHLFGDYVLKKIGRIMESALRSTNKLFRYGGEEFVVILPETSKHEGVQIAERLMDTIRGQIFKYEGHQAKITISIGGATYPEQSTIKNELIKFADKALYQAKEAGRNRCIFAENT
ncbi:MAG: diguanylate cyclase response regulator [Gammaproteobacteria bacterium]|nr:MAG: diguanylate cyclase response regulator [Deltaproteobacteria bacterium]PIE48133.1 MAG: diguanylate cyclase response regulator [Gammaproteobacteria bacterium]